MRGDLGGHRRRGPSEAQLLLPGLLFCGWRHGDCFTALHAWADLLGPEEQARLAEDIAGKRQGFLTSTGRFVDREEGMRLARAVGQTSSTGDTLFSEDLY